MNATNGSQLAEEYPDPVVVEEFKALRACLSCGLIKSFDMFYREGCENCEHLKLKDDSERVHDGTTAYFDGMIAMVDPQNSWVGRWEQISDCIPGMYAITMVGMLPPEMLEACEEQGFKARCTKSKPAASQN